MDSGCRSDGGAIAGIGWPAVVSAVTLGLVSLFFLALFVGLAAYAGGAAWRPIVFSEEFKAAALLTLGSTATATAIASLAAIGCAYALARIPFPGKVLVEALLDIPIVLPPLASGVALLILFGPVLGKPLAAVGLSVVFSRAGIVIAQAFIAIPFAIRMFRETLESIDARFEHVARTLGCSPGMAFMRVTVPLARRGIASGVAMTWARTVGEFGATAMLAGVTRMKTETLSAAIFLNMSAGELDGAIVISVLLLAVSMGALVAYRLLPSVEPRAARAAGPGPR